MDTSLFSIYPANISFPAATDSGERSSSTGAAIRPIRVSQGQGDRLLSHQKKAMARGISSSASREICPRWIESSVLIHTQPDEWVFRSSRFLCQGKVKKKKKKKVYDESDKSQAPLGSGMKSEHLGKDATCHHRMTSHAGGGRCG
ncbi:MAG: hypothetical protein U1E47_05265 [Rivihabitans pingtungensis]